MARVLLCWVVLALSGLFWTTPAQALTVEGLKSGGYHEMLCTFKQRCVINLPCEMAWRDHRWFLNEAEGHAYRVYRGGRISRKGQLMLDQRWKQTSQARAILMPMREAVASHLTVFDGGGAIYTLQYAANPGSGQFFLGQCEMVDTVLKNETSESGGATPTQ